jgi:hypothetical protein
MEILRAHRLWLGRAIVVACFAMSFTVTAANADGSSILGAFLNAMGNAVVLGSWQKVDAQTQDCLGTRFNMNPSDLAQQGILPTDPRVAPYIDQCQQLLAQQQQPDAQPQDVALQQPSGPPDAAELASRFGAKDAGLIAQGHIDIGMTEDEVMLAWGDPKSRNPSGHAKIVWDYGDDKVVFKGGKVAAVTH